MVLAKAMERDLKMGAGAVLKVSATAYKKITLLQNNERGIVSSPKESIYFGQPAFKENGKILTFNPEQGQFVKVDRTWVNTRVMVKLDERRTYRLPA